MYDIKAIKDKIKTETLIAAGLASVTTFIALTVKQSSNADLSIGSNIIHLGGILPPKYARFAWSFAVGASILARDFGVNFIVTPI